MICAFKIIHFSKAQLDLPLILIWTAFIITYLILFSNIMVISPFIVVYYCAADEKHIRRKIRLFAPNQRKPVKLMDNKFQSL